jgi:hypothetical protein
MSQDIGSAKVQQTTVLWILLVHRSEIFMERKFSKETTYKIFIPSPTTNLMTFSIMTTGALLGYGTNIQVD